MDSQEASGWCGHCRQQIMVRRPTTNEVANLIMILVTGGLWIPFWILLSLQRAKWRCTRCGRPATCSEHWLSDGFAFVIRTALAVAVIGGAIFVWMRLSNPPKTSNAPKVAVKEPLPLPASIQPNEVAPPVVDPSPVTIEPPTDPRFEIQKQLNTIDASIETSQATLTKLRKDKAKLIEYARAMDKVKMYAAAKNPSVEVTALLTSAKAEAKAAGSFSDAEIQAFRREEKGMVDHIAALHKQRNEMEARLKKESKP